jgi:hypothetical protein
MCSSSLGVHERFEVLRQLFPKVLVLGGVRDEDLGRGPQERTTPHGTLHAHDRVHDVVHVSSIPASSAREGMPCE